MVPDRKLVAVTLSFFPHCPCLPYWESRKWKWAFGDAALPFWVSKHNSRVIHNLPYPEKPVIVPAGQKPNSLTSTCCIISAQLTHLSGAVPHPSTGVKRQGHPVEWSKFLTLEETAHNSSEMHVLGLVFQVMCVHGEEEEKWAHAILPVFVQSFLTCKAFIENLFLWWVHIRKARAELSGVFRVLIKLI